MNNLKQVGLASFMYTDDNEGYLASYNYANNTDYVYPNGWPYNAGNQMGGLRYLTYESGYMPGFTSAGAPAIGQQPATTCPVLYPTVPLENNWGGGGDVNVGNLAYKQAGTYAFNSHFDQTIGQSFPGLKMQLLENVARLDERFMYTDGESWQARVRATWEPGSFGIWWGHNVGANFLFGDGHAARYSLSGFPVATGWPSQSWGNDTNLEAPW